MLENNIIDLQYPIGRFKVNGEINNSMRNKFISEIESAPFELSNAVMGLTNEQFDTPYRKGGWTVRQVIHHLPDSHFNAYMRFKLALTENEPLIKTYDEKKWAELSDYKDTPVIASLNLLEALHKRWTILLKSLDETDFRKIYIHPESGKVTIETGIAQYAWHGKHHIAHITTLRKRKGWE